MSVHFEFDEPSFRRAVMCTVVLMGVLTPEQRCALMEAICVAWCGRCGKQQPEVGTCRCGETGAS